MIPKPERGLKMNAWVSVVLCFSVIFAAYYFRQQQISWVFLVIWFVFIFVLLADSLRIIAAELDEIRKRLK